MPGVCVSHSVMSTSLLPHGLYSSPGSSVHGIIQARILEWVAIPLSRGSFWPKDQTQVSYITGRFFTIWTAREAPLNSLFFFSQLPRGAVLCQAVITSVCLCTCMHECIGVCAPTHTYARMGVSRKESNDEWVRVMEVGGRKWREDEQTVFTIKPSRELYNHLSREEIPTSFSGSKAQAAAT